MAKFNTAIVVLFALLLTACGAAVRVANIPKALADEQYPTLKVAIYPKLAMAGTGLRVLVYVETNPNNRGLIIKVDGEYYGRTVALDWSDQTEIPPRLIERRFEPLPEGHYTVTAILIQTGDKTIVAHEELCVMGSNTPCGA